MLSVIWVCLNHLQIKRNVMTEEELEILQD